MVERKAVIRCPECLRPSRARRRVWRCQNDGCAVSGQVILDAWSNSLPEASACSECGQLAVCDDDAIDPLCGNRSCGRYVAPEPKPEPGVTIVEASRPTACSVCGAAFRQLDTDGGERVVEVWSRSGTRLLERQPLLICAADPSHGTTVERGTQLVGVRVDTLFVLGPGAGAWTGWVFELADAVVLLGTRTPVRDYAAPTVPVGLVAQLHHRYYAALAVLETTYPSLVEQGKPFAALTLLEETRSLAAEVHRELLDVYALILRNRSLMQASAPARLELRGLGPGEYRGLRRGELRFVALSSVSTELRVVYPGETGALATLDDVGCALGYWALRSQLVSELEYLFSFLSQVVEPTFSGEPDPEGTRPSRYITAEVRRDVWRRDRGRCVECGSRERLEFDHVIAVANGGSNTARNVQVLCEDCNRRKSDKIA